MKAISQPVPSEEFCLWLKGIPHPNGEYTGEVLNEEGKRWHTIEEPSGDTFQTLDYPTKIINLCGPCHDGWRVKDNSNTIILEVTNYPQYLLKGESL